MNHDIRSMSLATQLITIVTLVVIYSPKTFGYSDPDGYRYTALLIPILTGFFTLICDSARVLSFLAGERDPYPRTLWWTQIIAMAVVVLAAFIESELDGPHSQIVAWFAVYPALSVGLTWRRLPKRLASQSHRIEGHNES